MSEDYSRTAREETPLERADRAFAELLQELRVTRTGVQILFAFLLSLAFTPRFPSPDAVRRGTYITTLLLAVAAAAGLAVLVLALTGSVLLVVDVTAGRAEGVAAGAAALTV